MNQLNPAPPIRIMIAEDDAVYRASMKQFLSGKADIELMAEAENGHELLLLLSISPVDVVLLDVHMPVLDGISTLPLIRKRHPETKVIILSMNNSHGMISQLMTGGAYAYLSKSSEAEIIYQTIYASAQDAIPRAICT